MASRKRPSRSSAIHSDAGRRRTDAANRVAKQTEEKAERSKATFDLPPDLVAELRVASVMLPPEVVGTTLSALAERALRRELDALRAEFNKGKPFPTPAMARARRGRPAGT